MPVWRQIIQRAWGDTWEKVVGQTVSTIVIAILIFTVVFLLARLFRGKEYAQDWLFDAVAGVCAVIIVGVLVFLAETFFVVPARLISEAQNQNSGLTNTVVSLTTSNDNLFTQKGEIQKKYDQDEVVIRAVQTVTGNTNGTSEQNLKNLSVKVEEMQNEIKNSAVKIAADTYVEQFLASDSNRCWILITDTNSNTKLLFLKMKHAPLDFNIQGWVSSPSLPTQSPLTSLNHVHNIVYTYCSGAWSLKDGLFSIQYVKDEDDTNVIKNVAFLGQDAYLDGKRLIIVPAADKP
jgi:hypothetical protein